MVGSGTTAKQLKSEGDAKIIGYGSMLLEGLVAVISLACVMILATDNPLINKSPNFIYAFGLGQFLNVIGISPVLAISFGLMAFTTFVYDTLDVSTRLGRYIIEELTGWRNKAGRVFATALTAGVPLFFVTSTVSDSQGNSIPAWKAFWNLFGASNQLLAGLALIGVTVWLFNTVKTRVWIVSFLPAVFMVVMSDWALVNMVRKGNFEEPEPYVAVVLLLLSLIMMAETLFALTHEKLQTTQEVRVSLQDAEGN